MLSIATKGAFLVLGGSLVTRGWHLFKKDTGEIEKVLSHVISENSNYATTYTSGNFDKTYSR